MVIYAWKLHQQESEKDTPQEALSSYQISPILAQLYEFAPGVKRDTIFFIL